MNIQKNILKIASDLANEMIKSFEMTEEEWKKYSEQHPNAKRENHTIVQKKTESENNKVTDEQKKLHMMSYRKDERIRLKAAEHPNTHPKTLDKLSDDENEEIRHSVAEHPNTSLETLKKLSDDESSNVRGGVAFNKKTPAEIL